MLNRIRSIAPGILFSAFVAVVAIFLSSLFPQDLIGATVLALLVGMAFHLLLKKKAVLHEGVNFCGKMILRLAIILMGINMNFSEVLSVGKYSLFVMIFTMATAFGAGNLLGKLFKMNWKLTNLLAVSTAICGGSAVAAVGPVMKARDEDIAYAISSTFIFDVLTVIGIPWIGLALNMSHTGYGLWVGTAVNDTSSVVAAGYAISELAGNTAVIVKLTRTLFIIPYVLIFSIITKRLEAKSVQPQESSFNTIKKVFPGFILFFLLVVALRSIGVVPTYLVSIISKTSKFCMVMALSAIGLKTSFQDIKNIGMKPMMLGFVVDTLVVIVSIGIQIVTGKF